MASRIARPWLVETLLAATSAAGVVAVTPAPARAAAATQPASAPATQPVTTAPAMVAAATPTPAVPRPTPNYAALPVSQLPPARPTPPPASQAILDGPLDFNVGIPVATVSAPEALGTLKEAQAALAAGQWLAARSQFNLALRLGLAQPDADAAKAALKDLAARMLFSLTVVPGDPYTELLTVNPGDTLLRIGAQYRIPSDLIMRINNIPDSRRLRAGQSLKMIKGPFNVIVTKSTFELAIYLGDNFETLVRTYPVALGADDSTPVGLWRVADRIPNPKFWGARNLPAMEADDPQNPLGEHWIALTGVKGEAVGMAGYGIHGTIEPDTIGQRVSLGCIRLRNEDVAEVFELLYPNISLVLVRP